VSDRRVAVPPAPATDPLAAARAARLRYVSDVDPGIRRRRAGGGFTYVDANGRRVTDADTLARIRALAVPPAWRDVWICPHADGHIQAVGRDARGRKQYRYHADWREVRDATKYDRMIPFARRLPAIRRRVAADLRRQGLPREKVLALVVRLLETTRVRVGNEEYARQNGSFGLTTLREHHARVSGARIRFRFRGKSGKMHDVDVEDRRIAKLVRVLQELPGQELFHYVGDDGEVHPIGSADVNDYLREVSGESFTAKDFRTWGGTVAAARALAELPAATSATAGKRLVVDAVKRVAEQLGNTAAVCRKCYIHPSVVDAFLAGTTVRIVESSSNGRGHGLTPEERAVLQLLRAKASTKRSSRREREVAARASRVSRPAKRAPHARRDRAVA
jgi:DNA topoisomerase I